MYFRKKHLRNLGAIWLQETLQIYSILQEQYYLR
jgi:hypothetical protein